MVFRTFWNGMHSNSSYTCTFVISDEGNDYLRSIREGLTALTRRLLILRSSGALLRDGTICKSIL